MSSSQSNDNNSDKINEAVEEKKAADSPNEHSSDQDINSESVYAAATRMIKEKDATIEELTGLNTQLEHDIKDLNKKNQELIEKLRSLYTDFQAAEQRHVKALNVGNEKAATKIFTDLCGVLDNFDRCADLYHKIRSSGILKNQDQFHQDISVFLEGFEMIKKDMMSILHKHGVEAIHLEPGQEFHVEEQEVISTESNSKYSSGTVSKVLSKGYKINGKVFRYAKVITAQ